MVYSSGQPRWFYFPIRNIGGEVKTPLQMEICIVKTDEDIRPVTLLRLWQLARDRPLLNHLGYPSAYYIRTLIRKIEDLEIWLMASKNSTKANNRNWTETTFVNLKIQGKHKDLFNEWMSRKDAEISLDVAAFMSNGHKTSITWDDTNNVWIVSATCKDEASKNLNHCLTSRSSEWWEAMCMNVYKNDVICKEGSWVDNSESVDWG